MTGNSYNMEIKEDSEDERTDEEIIDAAIELTGFGKFSIKIILINLFIFANVTNCLVNIGIIFPAAICDYHLSNVDAGIMITSSMWGMLISSCFWGSLADTMGRKYTLVIALLSQGIFDALASVISSYWGFLMVKFFSGISTNGQVILLRPYAGEFQSQKMRKVVFALLGIAWSTSSIMVYVIAKLIIPLEFSYTNKYFFFRSWNLFVLICALPAPLLALWLLKFPETPKYLAEFGEASELAKTLNTIYTENTGKSFHVYLEKLTNNGFADLYGRLTAEKNLKKNQRISKFSQTKKLFQQFFSQMLIMLKPLYLKRTLLTAAMLMCYGSAFFAMAPRFPDLFRRFSKFEEIFPNVSATICDVFAPELSANSSDVINECPMRIPDDVYVYSLITSAAELPLDILTPLTINRLGYKFFIVACSTVAAAVASGLYFIKSSTENLALAAVYQALTGTGISIAEAVVVEIYPTSMRLSASILTSMLIRIGSITGNLLVGYLIDFHCQWFLTVPVIQLIITTAAGILIPVKRKKI